jgi:superfamily II DNA or RNA helicase
MRSARPWPASFPSIVAEALVGVPDALLTALTPGPAASGAAVASALARSLAPPEHPATPPPWLLPEQIPSFRRILAALQRHQGALLADPVGSGKTYVALAVAAAMNRRSTACLVPATLLPQWKATADRLGVGMALCSHQQVSRGVLPSGTRGLVVIDESHHFRNPQTKRYQHLAPWLVGRPVLLVSATPIVNTPLDLAHQLLLAVRDDTLALDGVSSLRAMLARGLAGPALGQLVFERELGTEQRPLRVLKRSRAGDGESTSLDMLFHLASRLRLSKSDPIAGLMRGVLFRAMGSSPAAFEGALRRYRRLLLHARDAVNAGQQLDRAHLRLFTRDIGDQLVWWDLLPICRADSEIELGDLDHLDELIEQADAAAAQPDGKLQRLEDLLNDNQPTLVFTAFQDTVRYLCRRLSGFHLAWCTGEAAGVGSITLPRAAVLEWFRGNGDSRLAPSHLVVTDVAAEGLDLQRAARVVHYDLPWSPMRIEQREGRSIRYGSHYPEVDVVRFELPAMLEARIRLAATLAHKASLPGNAGVGPRGRHIWRWRLELAGLFREVPSQRGVARADYRSPGLLAGFALHRSGEPIPLSATVLWLEPGGTWTEAPDVIAERLRIAGSQHRAEQPPANLSEWLSLLAPTIRQRLEFARGRRWISPDPSTGARRALARLQHLIRDAARSHRTDRLLELNRALGFVAGGHTAGEAVLLERLAKAAAPDVPELMRRLPVRRVSWDGLEVRLTGLVVFGPGVRDEGP